MNFLFVLYIGFDRHGPSVHLLKDIIQQCLDSGHKAEIIVRNRGGVDPDLPNELKHYMNITVHVIKDTKLEKDALAKRYFDDIRYAFKCCHIYRNLKSIDAIFLQSCTSAIFPVMLLKRTLNRPILFNVQNIFPIDALMLGKLSKHGIKGIMYTIFRRMQQVAYSKVDKIVTVSRDMKQTLINENVDPKKLKVIYNWSYSDNVNDIPEQDNLFLKTHKIDPKLFRVVFAGNLGMMVNAEIIAEAATILQSEENIHFIIIGEGSNLSRLKSLAGEKHLTNISFYPYQPVDYAQHNYAMAHVNINALPKGIIKTCMPSKTATMLNAARPLVVAVDINSHFASMLEQVEQCSIVDSNDAIGFARSILLYYKQRQKHNSRNARSIVLQEQSKRNAGEYVKVLVYIASKNVA